MYFAPNFLTAQIFYSLNGVGSVIVAVMAPTLIAEIYPMNKKAIRISWVVSTAWIAVLVANPVTGFLTVSGAVSNWRNSLLWFLLPVTVLCSILVIFLVPSTTSRSQAEKEPFMDGFRKVLGNRSACACLANNFLAGVWLAAMIFPAAFVADVFGASPSLRGMIALIGLGALVAGTLLGGYLVNPIGRKNLMVVSAVSALLLSVLSYAITIIVPNMWLSIGIRSVAGFLGGLVFVAAPNMYLEQVPKYREQWDLWGMV
jgi:MFS family permease